jgi:hypothetical protein
MKRVVYSLIGSVIVAGTVLGQDRQAELKKESVLAVPERAKGIRLVVREEGPNEIIGKKFVFRGALVQLVKADNPLQLFNPFAPAEYGSGEQNLTRDLKSGKPFGLTLFSIGF